MKIENSSSLSEKRAVMEGAVDCDRKTQALITAYVSSSKKTAGPHVVSKYLRRRVTGALFAASRQMTLDILGCAGLEEFVDSAGGTMVKSKMEYVKLLLVVYEIVARLLTDDTGDIKVDSFMYDGWSSKLGAPIAGMTFTHMIRKLNLRTFPLCFFGTQEIGKSADEHETIISAIITFNEKL